MGYRRNWWLADSLASRRLPVSISPIRHKASGAVVANTDRGPPPGIKWPAGIKITGSLPPWPTITYVSSVS